MWLHKQMQPSRREDSLWMPWMLCESRATFSQIINLHDFKEVIKAENYLQFQCFGEEELSFII